MELTDNMSEIMNLYNFFDSVIVTDDRGIIKYYTNMRADVYWPDAKNITGMHILKLHPELTEETSSIMRVLKTGAGLQSIRKLLLFIRPERDKYILYSSASLRRQNGRSHRFCESDRRK